MAEQKECGVITCPQCGYKINELDNFRCPRCNASLLEAMKCSGNCKKCAVKHK
ncbi:hypothetical protein V6C27_00805 [Peptococcaceae bacterium 1198_IL3148]